MNQNYGQHSSPDVSGLDFARMASPEAARNAIYELRQNIPYVAFMPANASTKERASDACDGSQTVELPRIEAPDSVRKVKKTLLEIEKPDFQSVERAGARKVAKTLIELKAPQIDIQTEPKLRPLKTQLELRSPDLKKKASTPPLRERARTMIEAGSVDPKAIRRLLQSEFGSSPRVADDNGAQVATDANDAHAKVAKTLIDTYIPAPIVDEVSSRKNYVAKTRLDRMAIAAVVLRFDQRKEELEAELANELSSAAESASGVDVDSFDSLETAQCIGDMHTEYENFLAESQREFISSRRMLLAIVALAIISLVMVLFMPPSASPNDSSINIKLWASLRLIPTAGFSSQG